MGLEILKLVLGLAAVGGLMYFAWRKAQKLPGFGASGHVKVIERHQLTRNSVVAVLRDGDERVVVGAGDQGITELSRTAWSEPDPVTPVRQDAGKKFASTMMALGKKPAGQ